MAGDPTERAVDEVVQGFRDLLHYDSVTCAISDCMGRFGAMTGDLRPLFDGIRIAGRAVTALTLASDLAAVFKAIDVSQPGDIVVVDAHGSRDTAFWGENMTISARNRGVAGAIIDGACRDVVEIRRLRFPIFSRGAVPNVAAIAGYGQVNVRVQCAGQPVEPGDIVVADENGVVVIPSETAADVLARTRGLLETEHVLQQKLQSGATIGELIEVDKVFASTFDYQMRALKKER
ncbi:MAG TPA: RraA family protein [Burkholderiaceae bacterium]|nr:RraA family protein [Burkholderiaceae bacterium]